MTVNNTDKYSYTFSWDANGPQVVETWLDADGNEMDRGPVVKIGYVISVKKVDGVSATIGLFYPDEYGVDGFDIDAVPVQDFKSVESKTVQASDVFIYAMRDENVDETGAVGASLSILAKVVVGDGI